MASQQKVTIQISKKHNKATRLAIAKQVIEHIIDRTREQNLDKNGKPLAPYRSSYKKSLEFKIAGKGNRVDLTLTGEMLNTLKLLNDSKGEIVIGYDRGDEINGKVEGNRLGTYGQSKPVGPKRDFLGIQKTELKEIEEEYLELEKDELKEKLDEEGILNRKIDEIIGGRIVYEDIEVDDE